MREVENLVQRALILARGPELTVEDFAFDVEGSLAAKTGMTPSDSASLRDKLKDQERRSIMDALDRCQGNQSHAAKYLGMPRRTLVERLRVYGVTHRRKG